MNRQDVFNKIQEVFRDVLDNETIVLNEETSADDIEEWDSLTHIQLVVELEKAFCIKFSAKEILLWENVGEMADSIMAKIQ